MGVVEIVGGDARPDAAFEQPFGLEEHQSVVTTLDPRQRNVLAGASLLVAACLLIAPVATLIAIMTVTTVVYFATVCQRALITRRSLRDAHLVRVSDDDAGAVPDVDLPVYTVLVPAYREADIVPTLLTNLRAIDYPRNRLDIKLILEADDDTTIAAARAYGPDIELVIVEPGGPRTKPKALNVALQRAYGEYVTIYDAEDVPDPLQLRRAVVAFGRLPADVACLQAQLTFRDWDENIITRWFTIEYLMWFSLFLPGLSASDAPIPLGGTSNHIRRDVLESVGAWDSYNVTEDADLGVRLHRQGWHTAVLDSTTYEEPNNDFVNWMKQRSRWYKGYLQTWLVNLRHPVELWRELGTGGFLQFNLFVGGTPILSFINPIFWLLTLLWFVGKVDLIQQIFPAPLYHLALFCWVIGNLAILYITILAARRSSRNTLVWAACLVPAYWVMMSLAAVKAFWQVLAAPSFWEKTTHGLIGDDAPAPSPPADLDDAFSPDAALLAASAVAGPRDRRAGAPPAARPAPAPRLSPDEAVARRWLRRAHLGEVLRVTGALLVLFVGYLVIGTAWRADAGQRTLRDDLATATAGPPRVGGPLARIEAPAIGMDWVVVEGVGSSQLDRGPGHVPGTPNPGAPGDVVIVGHRLLASGPFRHLSSLRPGDTIALSAPWGRARYRVERSPQTREPPVRFTTRGPSRLTLVTDDDQSVGTGSRVVVTARLVSPRLLRAPAPADQTPALPSIDLAALPLLLAAVLAGALAWHTRRWFIPLWGRVRGELVVAPFVLLAIYEAFSVTVRLLPPTL